MFAAQISGMTAIKMSARNYIREEKITKKYIQNSYI